MDKFRSNKYAAYTYSRNRRYSQTVGLSARFFPWFSHPHSFRVRHICVYERQHCRWKTPQARQAVIATESESHIRREETRFIRYKPVVVGFRTTSYAFPVAAYIRTRTHIHTYALQNIIVCRSYVWRNDFFDFFARWMSNVFRLTLYFGHKRHNSVRSGTGNILLSKIWIQNYGKRI